MEDNSIKSGEKNPLSSSVNQDYVQYGYRLEIIIKYILTNIYI